MNWPTRPLATTSRPREVIRLMVNILFINDDQLLATPGTVRKLLDPACGTGGMLAEAQNYLREHHADARLYRCRYCRTSVQAPRERLQRQRDRYMAGNSALTPYCQVAVWLLGQKLARPGV